MNITQFFSKVLGANLTNVQWSWGAVAPVMNRVYLRVWADEIENQGNGVRVLVLRKNPLRKSAGYPERVKHLESIRTGAQGFGVVCLTKDPDSTGEKRAIVGFDDQTLLVLGGFTEDDHAIYASVTNRIPLSELARFQTAHSTLVPDLKSLLATKVVETTKEALIEARVGQGRFRAAVLKDWNGRCAVTGSSVVDAIRASHIKPWRESTNKERLDPKNGLPLIATLDALFDAGLISFTDSGEMLISPRLQQNERELLGVAGKSLKKQPCQETADYLAHHRGNVFCAKP